MIMKELWGKEEGRREMPSVTRFPGLVLFVQEDQDKQPDKTEPKTISDYEKTKMPLSSLPPAPSAPTIPSVTLPANNGNVNASRNNTTGSKGFWRRTPWTHWVAGVSAFLVVMGSLCLWVALANESWKQLEFDAILAKDVVMDGIAMDNPQLLEYIRNVHLKTSTNQDVPNATQTSEESYVATQLDKKRDGVYFEYISRSNGVSTTAWLEANLNWSGVLMQTDSRSAFQAEKSTRNPKSRMLHAGLSTDKHTKEITYHQEEEVHMTKLAGGPNSLTTGDGGLPPSRLKYFPLYTVLLAYNATTLDYMSLDGSDGHDSVWVQQILDTVPWDVVRITVLAIHWHSYGNEVETKRLVEKLTRVNYKLVKILETGKILFMYNRRLKI